jgi:hypothetical protein
MCSAPTCHVMKARLLIHRLHQAVVLLQSPEYQCLCLLFQFYRASNFYYMETPAELHRRLVPSAADRVVAIIAAPLEPAREGANPLGRMGNGDC